MMSEGHDRGGKYGTLETDTTSPNTFSWLWMGEVPLSTSDIWAEKVSAGVHKSRNLRAEADY
jgi:hypothetical protein